MTRGILASIRSSVMFGTMCDIVTLIHSLTAQDILAARMIIDRDDGVSADHVEKRMAADTRCRGASLAGLPGAGAVGAELFTWVPIWAAVVVLMLQGVHICARLSRRLALMPSIP